MRSGNSAERWTISRWSTLRLSVLTAVAAVGVGMLTVGAHAVSGAGQSSAPPSATGVQAIVPAAAWSDQNGVLDQLHGVGVLKVGDTYYAYGEDKTNGGQFTAVACYSSTDLVTWKRGPNALSLQASGDLGPNRVIERPKVLYNAATHKYVMWMHVDSTNYGDARAGVAESSTPCGPYTYLGSSRPLGQLSRDLNLFEDTDGTAYLLSEDRNNGLRIDKLSDNYESVVSPVAVLADYEAPAMVKSGGMYYLFGSHLTGWNTNDNDYTTATSLAGPWSPWKTFAPAGTNTFDSQTSTIVPVAGNKGTTYIYVGDRWKPSDLFDSAPIWLPISIGGGRAALQWVPSWTLEVAQGTWSPQIRTDTYEAGGPGTTLADGAAVTTCTGCTGESAVSGLGTLTFDDIRVPTPGQYTMTIRYVNPENTDKHAQLSADGQAPVTIAFPPTGNGNTTGVAVATLNLHAGSNTLRFGKTGDTAPAIDTVAVPQPG